MAGDYDPMKPNHGFGTLTQFNAAPQVPKGSVGAPVSSDEGNRPQPAGAAPNAPTPRTDAAINEYVSGCADVTVVRDAMRQIERELAVAKYNEECFRALHQIDVLNEVDRVAKTMSSAKHAPFVSRYIALRRQALMHIDSADDYGYAVEEFDKKCDELVAWFAAFDAGTVKWCMNCDTEVPPGCEGRFKKDGESCLLNK